MSSQLEGRHGGRSEQQGQSHVAARRIWNYSVFKTELSQEEHAHLGSCKTCLEFFRICILADSLDEAEKLARGSINPAA